MIANERTVTRRRGRSRVVLGAAALVLVVAAVACRPLPLGGPTATVGNDVVACPQFQPSPTCPMPGGPSGGGQPLVWAAIQGPYEAFANGDPYSTKCGRNLPVSPTDCSSGPHAGGATNELYDPTGYEFAVDVKQADVGRPMTLQVWDAGSYQRTTGVGPSVDCATTAAPFNAAPYSGSVSAANCQTGDAGSAPFQIQLFANDGVDTTIDYTTPIPGCHLHIPAGTGTATYKNAWASVCTFTPTMAGVYPLRVKSSSIRLPDGTVLPDAGSGYNSYALRLQGSTATTLRALDVFSINANTPGDTARFYLAEIKDVDAGNRLQIDIFDPGDGASGDATIQILAPPSGAPTPVPAGGTTIPAANVVDQCRYNPVVSPTRGPEVASPAGAPALNCSVVTRSGGINRYDNGWLSIEVSIAPNYHCLVDCWWSVRYATTGGTGQPADRMVWAPILIDV